MLAEAAIVVEVELDPNVAHDLNAAGDAKAPLNPARDDKVLLDTNVALDVKAPLLVILVVSHPNSLNVNVDRSKELELLRVLHFNLAFTCAPVLCYHLLFAKTKSLLCSLGIIC